jgi:hypothetical protein
LSRFPSVKKKKWKVVGKSLKDERENPMSPNVPLWGVEGSQGQRQTFQLFIPEQINRIKPSLHIVHLFVPHVFGFNAPAKRKVRTEINCGIKIGTMQVTKLSKGTKTSLISITIEVTLERIIK